ncbi:MAG: endonuclease/exonuclease/phosphatase family protein [Bacteroidia bacterium]
MAKAPEVPENNSRPFFLLVLDRLCFVATWLLIGLTIIALFAPRIHPGVTTIPAFCNLIFPATMIGLVSCIVYWMLRRRLRFIYPLVAILISTNELNKTVALHFRDKNPEGKELALMTYNVKKFYSDEKESAILKLIATKNPDVLFFQEFVAYNVKKENRTNILSPLLDSLGYTDFYFMNGDDFSLKVGGTGIVSRYPLINPGVVPFPENSTNSCVYADMVKDNDTIRVMSVHLQSINLTDGKKEAGMDEQEQINKNRRRLATAFVQRARQADRVLEIIRQSPYPVVLAGDFNDTPLSYTYNKFRSHLQDAFIKDGLGLGITYAGRIPLLRIDYILPDTVFAVSDFEVIRKNLSDHYPVFCKIHWK